MKEPARGFDDEQIGEMEAANKLKTAPAGRWRIVLTDSFSAPPAGSFGVLGDYERKADAIAIATIRSRESFIRCFVYSDSGVCCWPPDKSEDAS